MGPWEIEKEEGEASPCQKNTILFAVLGKGNTATRCLGNASGWTGIEMKGKGMLPTSKMKEVTSP
jgi:hypothetical protein